MTGNESRGPGGDRGSASPVSERTRLFMERLKLRYQRAYAAALEAGKEKLQDLRKTGSGIEPRVRHLLGQLNESLARKAIPPTRRKQAAGDAEASPPSPPLP